MKLNITIEISEEELRGLIEPKYESNSNKDDLSKTNASMYAKVFDESSEYWTKDSEYNIAFLKQQEEYCTALLKSKRKLYLNDVYDRLGIPRTKTGSIVGWFYDEEHPIGDNRVDFGIFDLRNTNTINGYSNTFILDFNVDGDITYRF